MDERAGQTRSLEPTPKRQNWRRSLDRGGRPTRRAEGKRLVKRRKARRQLSHAWRQNGEKRWRDKQRTSPPEALVFMLVRAEEPTGGSQSARSSDEVGNDHGAKGRRKVKA